MFTKGILYFGLHTKGDFIRLIIDVKQRDIGSTLCGSKHTDCSISIINVPQYTFSYGKDMFINILLTHKFYNV